MISCFSACHESRCVDRLTHPRHQVELLVKLHAAAVITRKKSPTHRLNRRMGEFHGPSRWFRQGTNLLLVSGTEPRFLSFLTSNKVKVGSHLIAPVCAESLLAAWIAKGVMLVSLRTCIANNLVAGSSVFVNT